MDESFLTFLQQSWQELSTLQHQSGQAMLAAICTILISSMKVSGIRKHWNNLGEARVLMAPALSLVLALAMVHPFTFSTVIAALLSGCGAIALHELLDGLKSMPFVGPHFQSFIDFVEDLIGPDEEPQPQITNVADNPQQDMKH